MARNEAPRRRRIASGGDGRAVGEPAGLQPADVGPLPSLPKRLAWFAVLWIGGVLVLGVVALAIKTALGV